MDVSSLNDAEKENNPLLNFVRALARWQARIDAGLEDGKALSPTPPTAKQKQLRD